MTVSTPSRRLISSARTLAAACLLSGFTALVQAQPAGSPSMEATGAHDRISGSHTFGVRAGTHGAYRNASIFWQSPTWWTHSFDSGGRVDLIGEAAATYWRARRGEPKSLWQVGVAPILRWWPSSSTPYYLEAGAGVTYVSRTRLAGYRLSTAMQFGTHIGAGYLFNERHQLGLRLSHYSNARIKRPNNGLNIVQLEYAVRF